MLNKLLFNKGTELQMEIFTPFEFLLDIEETRPKPARNFIPQWWKTMPRSAQEFGVEKNTVKTCPSFVQMFSQGIVLPMWCDTVLSKMEQQYFWRTANDNFTWEFHSNWQFLDHVDIPEYKQIYKAVCPWYIKTPPNVSVFQFPMFFDFNQDWTIMPGVLNTDFYYQLNQQVIYTSQKDEIKINRGEAFVWYIPFVRTKFDYKTYLADERMAQIVKNQANAVTTKFSGHYVKEMKRRGIQ